MDVTGRRVSCQWAGFPNARAFWPSVQEWLRLGECGAIADPGTRDWIDAHLTIVSAA
jgi:hypothetical protein